jgi:hypothetical protein
MKQRILKVLVMGGAAVALLAMGVIAASAQATLWPNETDTQIIATAACGAVYVDASSAAMRMAQVTDAEEQAHFSLLSDDLRKGYGSVQANPDLLCERRLTENLRRLTQAWLARADELVRKRDAELAARIAAEVQAEIAAARKE